MNEQFAKDLIALWDEYAKTKTWWEREDATFLCFMRWVEKEYGKPLNPPSL